MDARNKAKLSQEKLAEKFGCDRSSISNMETGRIPLSPAMMMAYNTFLNVDMNLLKELTSDQKNTRGREKLNKKFKIAEKLASYERKELSPTLQSLIKKNPDIIEALNDPVALKVFLTVHKTSDDIKQMYDVILSLPKKKRKALLTFVESMD